MTDDARRHNLLGAFVLAVADRIRVETENSVGHSGSAAAALVTIAHFPGRTVEFLRQAIGLSHPAAVRVVDRLVEQGLVRRRPSGPGPAVALTVTTAGRRWPASWRKAWPIWPIPPAPRSAGSATRAAAAGRIVRSCSARSNSARRRPSRGRCIERADVRQHRDDLGFVVGKQPQVQDHQ
jgi:DNA-binding MarR family transcriptional regulator